MKRNIPLLSFLLLVVILGFLHFAGIYLHLYWRVQSFDRLVHIIGGFFVAIASLSIIYGSKLQTVKRSHSLMVGIFAALVVGILWEIFEVQNGITSLRDIGYWIDSIGDILSDFIGGCLAALYFIQLSAPKKI